MALTLPVLVASVASVQRFLLYVAHIMQCICSEVSIVAQLAFSGLKLHLLRDFLPLGNVTGRADVIVLNNE